MSTQSKLSAHNAVEQQRKSIAARLAGMIWHPSSIRRAFGSQDESTGPRSTLQPDAVFSNGAAKGAAMLKEATRNWKVGACQIKHEATIADPKDGCTMRFAILIPFSNGQERGQTSVPASVRIAGGRLYINNEQRTAEMARKASRGEHLSATDVVGMKRSAQYEDAPRASGGLEKIKSQKDALLARIDKISQAVEKAEEAARFKTLKKHGIEGDEGMADLKNEGDESLHQYAQELQAELQKTKARVLKTSDGLLVTLEVKTKRNPKYESVMTFLANFFSRANKFVDTLVARYTWMSKTMSAFETDDPKKMTNKLKQTDKNETDLAKFKEDRGVADKRQRWQSDKFPPAVNAPASKDGGPIEERYARLVQADEGFETSSGDIGEDFRDARDAVSAFNDITSVDEETASSLADDQQLDNELPQPVTEVGDRVAHRNVMMLPFDSGRTAAQQPDPRLPFTDASTTPMAAFRRAKKAEASAPAPAKSKRQAMLDEGWSEAEVDAHLAGSK